MKDIIWKLKTRKISINVIFLNYGPTMNYQNNLKLFYIKLAICVHPLKENTPENNKLLIFLFVTNIQLA